MCWSSQNAEFFDTEPRAQGARAAESLFSRHANPLWDVGLIKLWSRKTLTRLLAEAGFVNLRFRGVGRLPGFWMTMVVRGDKPLV